MQVASTMRSSNSIRSAYSAATLRATSRKTPSEHFMIFALCTAVTLRRPFATAYSKAARTMRSDPVIDMGLMEMPESGRMVPAPFSATHAMSSAASELPSANSMPA